MRTFKVRFHPSVEQIKLLKEYFGTCRYLYNYLV